MKAVNKSRKKKIFVVVGLCKLAVITLSVFALTIFPYRFDLNKGAFKSAVLLADDGGHGGGDGDGGHDGDGDGGDDGDGGYGDDDGDDGNGDDDGDDGYGDDDGDDGDDDGEGHGDDDGDHGSDGDDSNGDDHGSSDNSGDSSGAGDRVTDLSDVSGMQGLLEVSPAEEAALVGNWGKTSKQ